MKVHRNAPSHCPNGITSASLLLLSAFSLSCGRKPLEANAASERTGPPIVLQEEPATTCEGAGHLARWLIERGEPSTLPYEGLLRLHHEASVVYGGLPDVEANAEREQWLHRFQDALMLPLTDGERTVLLTRVTGILNSLNRSVEARETMLELRSLATDAAGRAYWSSLLAESTLKIEAQDKSEAPGEGLAMLREARDQYDNLEQDEDDRTWSFGRTLRKAWVYSTLAAVLTAEQDLPTLAEAFAACDQGRELALRHHRLDSHGFGERHFLQRGLALACKNNDILRADVYYSELESLELDRERLASAFRLYLPIATQCDTSAYGRLGVDFLTGSPSAGFGVRQGQLSLTTAQALILNGRLDAATLLLDRVIKELVVESEEAKPLSRLHRALWTSTLLLSGHVALLQGDAAQEELILDRIVSWQDQLLGLGGLTRFELREELKHLVVRAPCKVPEY